MTDDNNNIEPVDVYRSYVYDHNGGEMGAGFAVIIKPMPETSHQKFQVAREFRYALENLVLDDK